MDAARWPVAALAGLVVAVPVAFLAPWWPSLAVAAGIGPVALVVFRGDERKYYSAAGSAYVVGLGAVAVGGLLPAAFRTGSATSLIGLGLVSAAIVAVVYSGEGLLKRSLGSGEDGDGGALDAVLTGVTAIRLVRSILAASRTALFVGSVVLVGTATLVLDGAGVAITVDAPVAGRIDVILLGFVAVVLAGFHGLAVAHTTWLAARDVAAAGRSVGERVTGRATESDDPEPTGGRADDQNAAADRE